jgi:ribose 5-phosphate isomerase B
MIAIGCDHAGLTLKEEIKVFLDSKNIAYKDYGTYTTNSVDYPDMAKTPCEAVLNGECEKALLFCGTGIGISIAANKIKGIRACVCSDVFSAKYTRLHNDANVLCLGSRVVGIGLACELVDIFLNTDFEGGRHTARVEKLNSL